MKVRKSVLPATMLALLVSMVVAVPLFAQDAGDISFQTPVSYASGTQNQSEPVSVTNADLDDDGDRDLITTNQLDGSISVFINDGDGTYETSLDVTIPSPSGSTVVPRPMGVATADFNRDGDEDIVISTPNVNGIYVILATGGQDTVSFGTPQFLASAGSRAFGLAVGDFNADSRQDIAVTNLGVRTDTGTDSISIFLNNVNGTGNDGTFARTDITLGVGDSPSSAKAADLDGDGDLDLAVTNDRATATTDDVTIFINTAGTFTVGGQYEAGDAATASETADVDGDGDLDLIVANLGNTVGSDDDVSVLLNDGDGTFAAPVNYEAGDGPRAVTVADFDSDGDLDFAVPYENETATPIISVFVNDGEGVFERQDVTGGADSRGITSEDFDDDGRADLAAPDRGPGQDAVIVLLNDTNRPPTAADDSYSLREDQTLQVDSPGVLRNDEDADDDSLTATVVTGPENGTLDLDADGSFTYRPDLNYSGTDSFTYEAADGNGGTDTATVGIEIAGVDDDCTIRGTSGDDVLIGTPGRDVICAGAGNDTVRGGSGNDTIFGGPGNDNLRGDAGRDTIFGGTGQDTLNGRDGRPGDTLNGNAGRDTCSRDDGDRVTSCP